VHFQVFLLAGAGGAAFTHESVNLCASPGAGPCAAGDYQTTTSLKPVGEVGGGLRVYLGQRWSLRTEVRAFLYPASVLRDAELTLFGLGQVNPHFTVHAGVGVELSYHLRENLAALASVTYNALAHQSSLTEELAAKVDQQPLAASALLLQADALAGLELMPI